MVWRAGAFITRSAIAIKAARRRPAGRPARLGGHARSERTYGGQRRRTGGGRAGLWAAAVQFLYYTHNITTMSACEVGNHAECENTRASRNRRHRRRMGGAGAAFWNRRHRGRRQTGNGRVDTRRGGQRRTGFGAADLRPIAAQGQTLLHHGFEDDGAGRRFHPGEHSGTIALEAAHARRGQPVRRCGRRHRFEYFGAHADRFAARYGFAGALLRRASVQSRVFAALGRTGRRPENRAGHHRCGGQVPCLYRHASTARAARGPGALDRSPSGSAVARDSSPGQ